MTAVEPVRLRGRYSTATLYCADCLTLLPLEADAVISDPPYGVAFAHGGGGGCLAQSTRFAGDAIVGDAEPFDPSPWLSYRVIALWGANHYASRLPNSACWLVWDKRDGICSNDQADCELAWTNLKSPARLKRHLWNGMLKQSERDEVRLHPMQKPVALLAWAMEQCRIANDATVLDPYMGSGTTGVACARTHRNFIGVEIDPKHFDNAVRRIQREIEQQLI